MPDDVEGASQVDTDHAVPEVQRKQLALGQGLAGSEDARAVHRHMQRPKRVDCELHGGLHTGVVGHIRFQRTHAVAQRGHLAHQAVFIQVDRHHLGARIEQGLAGCKA